jgi:hypothetical protein
MSFRFRLDPPQLRQRLARGSKPLRGEHTAATVARAAEPPAVDLQVPPVTPSERSRPEESHAPMTSAPPLVHKLILWTRTTINPSKSRRIATGLLAGVIAKLPANDHVLRREGNRFTARGRWFKPSRAHQEYLQIGTF